MHFNWLSAKARSPAGRKGQKLEIETYWYLFQVSRLKEQAELLESRFVGMETFKSLTF